MLMIGQQASQSVLSRTTNEQFIIASALALQNEKALTAVGAFSVILSLFLQCLSNKDTQAGSATGWERRQRPTSRCFSPVGNRGN